MKSIIQAAELLFQARQTRQRLSALPAACHPADLPTAYAMQDAVTERLLTHYGGQRVGYKIACTNKAAQHFLGLDTPFYGTLLSPFVHLSPMTLSAHEFFMCVIEPEFAFLMASDLPPIVGDCYTQEQVTAAIEAVLPAIEVVDSRYTQWTTVGAAPLVADSASHGAWVRGTAMPFSQDLDLASHEVTLVVNGAVNQTGQGRVVLGNPLTALTWLVQALNKRGIGLKVGDLITTGVCVNQVYNAQLGDEIVADFGGLGQVVLRLQ